MATITDLFDSAPRLILVMLMGIISGIPLPIQAQDKVVKEKKAAVEGIPLQIVITAVQRSVQVRTTEDDPWQEAKVGMELGPGAEFRTGPRSSVRFNIPPDQTVTLDRLGTIKVLEALQQEQGKKVKIDLGMQYGRTHYNIAASGVEHESVIRSPSVVLGVRGSDVTMQFDAFTSYASGEGKLRFFNRLNRESIAFGRNVRSKMRSDRQNPPLVSQEEATIDAKGQFAGRTVLDQQLNQQAPNVGGDDYRVVVGLQRMTRFSSSFARIGVPKVPGPLNFTLTWKNVEGSSGTANLDLSVIDSKGEALTASAPRVRANTLTAGMHFGDNLGMATVNVEQVTYPYFFPQGTYHLQVDHRGDMDQNSAQIFLTGTRGAVMDVILSEGVAPARPRYLVPGGTFEATVAP